jgi:hypothetical protein
MPIDECARVAESGHANDQPESTPFLELPDDEHRHRSHQGERLAFRGTAENTIWRYELEPTANRARLADGRHAENGSKAVAEP